MKMKKFVVEHLEPRMYKWCVYEYENISKIVGKKNLILTNVRKAKKVKEFGKVYRESVKEVDLKKSCLLDPAAKRKLTTKIAKRFEYFVFGGILGDYPAKKRTKKELASYFKHRFNLGREQMATDNAVYVTREIIKGKKLEELNFVDGVEIRVNKVESTILPYKYVIADGKPLISERVIRYLKRKSVFGD